MGKGKGTPDELDYLFERDIIDEEDYVDFWTKYWKARKGHERQTIINDYLEIANQTDKSEILSGVITKDQSEARKQAGIIGGKVVRRNSRGQFSKRGHYYQAVRKGKHADKKTKATKASKKGKRRR